MFLAQSYHREESKTSQIQCSKFETETYTTYSSGAMKKASIKLKGAGYTYESGALIIPTVLLAKKAKYCASASSITCIFQLENSTTIYSDLPQSRQRKTKKSRHWEERWQLQHSICSRDIKTMNFGQRQRYSQVKQCETSRTSNKWVTERTKDLRPNLDEYFP
jgi:hypothetical protein